MGILKQVQDDRRGEQIRGIDKEEGCISVMSFGSVLTDMISTKAVLSPVLYKEKMKV